MNDPTRPASLLLLTFVVGLAGCTGPGQGSDNGPDPGTPSEAPFVVGPDGGTHDFGGATLVVPAGALEEKVELRLIETEAEAPVPYTGLSNVWMAQPEGLVFAEPVQVWIPIDADAVDAVQSGDLEPGFFWSENTTDTGEDDIHRYAQVERTTLDEDGSVLRTWVDHFSTGFIASVPVFSVVEPEPFPPADVLFVIDNSCSMVEHQNQLASDLSSFLPVLGDSVLDYHVGVVSTDMSDTAQHAGKLQFSGIHTYIDPQTPTPEAIFADMVALGTGGDPEEQGRAAAYTMVELKPDIPRNQGFLREDGTLTFVFVSDEEDQSGGNPLTRQEFREWMETKRARPEDVVAHAIVDPPDVLCPAGYGDGMDYERYANWTGGEVFNLCAEDWSPYLDTIAHGLFDVARVQLDPPAREIDVVAITEGGVETLLTEDDWTYDAETSTVYLVPGIASAALESIRVDYTPG